ncbi:MAG TPA: hypothetical protein VGC26_02835 [Afipia sp.]
MHVVYELRGFLKDEGLQRALHVQIFSPVAKNEDYSCVVRVHSILDDDREIYGIDEKQALYLAKNFVLALLDDHNVVDDRGMPLSLDTLKHHDS